ncbi:collectin-11 [Plakobranchus ocellatus]|uniref:Collectin-11 n=1 Tax=Plakobranchus ocellatus TaxID=259542 RepID=A0AAV3Y5P7_9GAST|nr:collectin-11 [Plakobranchus ocellatus]
MSDEWAKGYIAFSSWSSARFALYTLYRFRTRLKHPGNIQPPLCFYQQSGYSSVLWWPYRRKREIHSHSISFTQVLRRTDCQSCAFLTIRVRESQEWSIVIHAINSVLFSRDTKQVNKLGSEITSFGGEVNSKSPARAYMKYKSPDDGYCYHYRCTAKVNTGSGRSITMQKVTNVDRRDRTQCTQICAADEKVAQLEEKRDQCFAQAAGFAKLLSINRRIFLISALYKGRVYIMNKKTESFSLQKMNDRCKENGGYLVEIDDQEEQEFVAKFSIVLGSSMVYIGANDVKKEGTFVQYNSNKLVRNVKWMKGEPSNYKGVEHCVVIRTYGLNDISCGRTYRYICEVPLF